jgi:methenyltetrahydrofolate cyclohydrolase
MELINFTVKQFIDEVDSERPAPGGGSVSALASSLGIALGRMVGHLTIGKKRYLQLDENIKKDYEEQFQSLLEIKEKMMHLIEEDTIAFNQIMAAFKLPKEHEDEIQARNLAIEEATLKAIEVPYQMAKHSYQALILLEKMMPYGNKNAISDIGVGALLIYSGLEGSLMNVAINLSGLSHKQELQIYKEHSADLLTEGKQIKERIKDTVYEIFKD